MAVEAELPRRDAVDPIGADQRRRLDPLPTDAKWRELDPRVVAELGAGLPSLLDEERVQPTPLRHHDQRLPRPPHEAAPIAEPELEDVDLLLDDGVDRERQEPQCAIGQPAAAGLVAGEASLVGEQHSRARARQVKRGRRAGGSGADHDSVESLRRYYGRSPGGVPEWPKGTGCKPVGSAFGGSNPPAPTPCRQIQTTGRTTIAAA